MGWNGSEVGSSGTPALKRTVKKHAGYWRGFFAALLIIGGAVAAFIVISGRDGKLANWREEALKPRKIAETTPDVVRATEQTPAEEEMSAEDAEKMRLRRERAEKLRNMTPDERIDFLFEEAAATPIDLEPRSNQVFRTGTEQVMSWIFTARLGDMPTALPRMSIRDEAHLAEIIMNSVKVEEGDSEKVALAKEMVQAAKDELKRFIKEGGNVTDFLEYYHGQLVSAHNEWRDSRNEMIRVIKEDPTIAKEYIKEVNQRLVDKGIKPVTIPPGLLLKYGIDPDED